ncbi:MAG: hypothetical protein KatS3mg025_1383 [Bacteroidia bacterium]|nr:MAG: hypothetical protein KatS3mg025_1383 [Bacteroidia bacterium]
MRQILAAILSWGSWLWGQTWYDVNGGTDGPIDVLYAWQGALYVGGRFQNIGGNALQAQGIARFVAGQGWQRVGPGLGAGGTGAIYAITEYQGKLIVGGEFAGIGNSSAQNLAAYDPTTNTWSAVGGGVSGPVYALAVYDGELLVGGGFTQVGNPPQYIAYFARWNGSQWLAPDPSNTSQLLMGGVPRAFGLFQNKLYVAGSFVAGYYNNTDLAYLAIWNKAQQRLDPAYPSGQGPNNNIWCATVWNGKLYIGGDFTIAGSASGKLVTFDGNQFQSVPGAPTSGSVRALLPVGSDLYVAGSFTSLGNGTVVNRVAKLSSTGSWSALGSGLGPTIVSSLAWYNNALYAGGSFTQDGGGSLNVGYIAAYGTSAPAALHQGFLAQPFYIERLPEGVYFLVAQGSLQDKRLRLWDAAGHLLHESPLSLNPGDKYPLLLPPTGGLYLVEIQGATGERYTFKVVPPLGVSY